ncbi:MAG: hypothetical protein A2V69_02965 [Candidatus Portnoybacteria bacterium RBG_13_40_8]|uniref:Nudix hydrolase domain-containing protein n=1 Tax=Candidatus Portnoybacteria bacterium RBG_13_40_8 TaxID=1801990 RepID=A0A1G2F4J2_9BACT|nr:MAG: hypothetical protein A2V69_02965 [Candidatus Portnoybacteria bacterium RBG_13_40_8]OGZ35528.1 MAG: hypothetical protein A2V60_02390 [Candidatus Portnoybacteria bacterium RIFCSPHIGHO2_01_FULL_39_19]
MEKRVAAVIIKDNKILLMRRIKDGQEYFVFPGGGIKENESVEDAIIREIKEELSLDAKIDKLLFQIENRGQEELYFLIKEFSGIPELSGPEKERMNENNQYYPEWIDLDKIQDLSNLYPEAVRKKVKELI